MPRIALTFDDGPNPHTTEKILSILRKYAPNAQATWMLQGNQVEQYPELARKIRQAHHYIGNHSWDHPYLTELRDTEVREQINHADTAISKATGLLKRQIVYVRPPYGDTDERVDTLIRQGSDVPHKIMLWTTDTMDWSGIGEEEIKQNFVAGLKEDAVFLMHDGSIATVNVLPQLLQLVQSGGYEIVPLNKLRISELV